jgi:hypothetical protein
MDGLDAAVWEALTSNPGVYMKRQLIMDLSGTLATERTYNRRLREMERQGWVERYEGKPKFGWRAVLRPMQIRPIQLVLPLAA